MENYTFKSVAFGGFDKQDVIHYIEQTSKEAAENLEKLRQERDSLQTEAESLRSQVRELQTRLEAESSLREQAQSQLEAEQTARQELEADTLAKLRRTVELFRSQYVTLMSTFESTASHVTAELRKVEVNMTQLPRAMDQAGTELNELAAQLEHSAKKEEK